MSGQLKINEIFYSIQGESSWVGYPTVFVRLTGCNLRCHYCDTKYSYYEGEIQAFDKIFLQIEETGAQYVCVTGGEPLLQPAVFPFMQQLCDRGYKVSLETSGAKSCEKVDPRVKIILDVKTPASGEEKSFDMRNLELRRADTEFKFVIADENDFDWAENFIREHNLANDFSILYSPSFGQISEKWLAKKILSEKSSARLQLQLHKYIWPSDTRGV